MDTIITILLTLFGAGIIYSFSSGFLNKSKIMEVIHRFKQKQKEEEVEEIEKKQDVLNVEIEKLEDITDDTKSEIEKIKKEAKEKILDSLSKDSIKETEENINDKWNKI